MNEEAPKRIPEPPRPPAPGEPSGFQVDNAEEFARNVMRLFEESAQIAASYLGRSGDAPSFKGSGDMNEAAKAFGAMAQQWMNNPAKILEAQGALLRDYSELWNRSIRRFFGEEVQPVIEPLKGDNRFKDEGWSDTPFFDFWKQSYLLTSRWVDTMVKETEGLDLPTRRKAEFYINQIAAALSPSNFAVTNPEVMRTTLSTNGANLVAGMQMFAEDLKHSKGMLRVSQTDYSAFEVGRNLAVTPGKVVFQNDIIQLIQYSPTTEKVREIPLLIVPPWINKYYILDLVPEKSYVRWAVEQGFTVFMVSWVNPDGRLATKSFEDYMKEGILAAVEAVNRITSLHKVNAVGYCVGGTLLASTLAWMAAKGDDRINAATFLTAQVDFQEAGDLLVFIDDTQLKSLEEMMAENGFLDGSRMANVFNMLRPRDLIWPYVVNNYLLGKKPMPFDLLFWNSDSTRMPAANHAFYLRNFYHFNKLAKGEMTLGGVKLDLSKVKVPIYELATREDHIAPAKSVFIGMKLFGGDVRLAIAGSGHIAGVVNPPEKKKYQHWVDGPNDAKTLDAWLEGATEAPGSWWPDWAKWLHKRSGKQIEARKPGSKDFPPIEDAPGSYVKDRSAIEAEPGKPS